MANPSSLRERSVGRYLLCLLLFVFGVGLCEAGTFCAIAVSPSTGRYGHARNYDSRAGAERAALAQCGVWDARIATWGYNGYLALAIGSRGAWGGGYGRTERLARASALARCPAADRKVVLVVYSLAR